MVAFALLCVFCGALCGAPVIHSIQRFPSEAGSRFLLSATNDAGQKVELDVYQPATTPYALFSMGFSADVQDKTWVLMSTNLFDPSDLSIAPNSWPQEEFIEYNPHDKASYEADTNTYPHGFDSYQAGGPEHAFYMGKYEISNAEFCRFLNDAELHSNDVRSANMYFGSHGYVVFNPASVSAEKPTSNDLFDIAASSDFPIDYIETNPAGTRYVIEAGFENKPVAGVSWYGAVKYCNWLTIDRGIGAGQRSYTEGDEPADWRPVPATNWPVFTADRRRFWVEHYGGYRLPMLDTNGWGPSLYNEFHKASLWNGSSNTIYGFGRNTISGKDANYRDSGDPYDDSSTPQGFYDGLKHQSYQTTGNSNGYGIYDLNGNMSEWMNASYILPQIRLHQGGSFLHTQSQGRPWATNTGSAHLTVDFIGFRVTRSVTVAAPPLDIYPVGATEAYTNYPQFFLAFGGSGEYSWSIGDTNIGSLSTNNGPSIIYRSFITNVVQEVILCDGLTCLTTSVSQLGFEWDLPPLPF